MQTNYYNRSNNFSAPIRKEPKPYSPASVRTNEDCAKKESKQTSCDKPKDDNRLLKNLKNDDLLILGLIFLFLSDSNDDTLMLLALVYLFLCSQGNK